MTEHNCINLRLPTHGGIYVWEFEKQGREVKVRVEGQLVFNNIALRLNAALGGLGLTYLPEDAVAHYLASGQLVQVLEDWCPPFAGYHLYYPSRRQTSPAFASGRGRASLSWSASQVIPAGVLHVSLNRIRFRDKNMQPFKVLQRPLRV